jgi:L-threonylcarbamoyladenylate synthase
MIAPLSQTEIDHALSLLKDQSVIAYPTESVFGLGCDPDCDIAINKILALKQRPAQKGLILIASDMAQLSNYADFSLLSQTTIDTIKNSWPGAITWVVPVKASTSKLICGDFNSVAVRVTTHPLVQQLCRAFKKPLISTSANLSGLDACVNDQQVRAMFIDNPLLGGIVKGNVLGNKQPSQIFNALTGDRLR